jgi:hypothetical protein
LGISLLTSISKPISLFLRSGPAIDTVSTRRFSRSNSSLIISKMPSSILDISIVNVDISLEFTGFLCR